MPNANNGRRVGSRFEFEPQEEPEPATHGSLFTEQYRELVAAMRFLSIVPLPGSAHLFDLEDDESLVMGTAYFSFVGLVLGAILWVVALLGGSFLPPLALAAILVVGLVILTGGLHLDGLMDTFDGLIGGTTRERKLEIMRDSRLGSFGALAGACVLLLKFSFLASLDTHLLPVALLMILPVSRWAVVLAVYAFPSARPTGLGAAFRQTVTVQRLVIVGVLALVVAFLFGHIIGVIIWLCGSVFALLIGTWITNEVGGLTGDSYGALAELGDAFLLLLVLGLHTWL
jgi:adenosylcobinamide-GDP ribazoletransferase